MKLSARIYYNIRKMLKMMRIFFMVVGPGLLVMVADNDAGGITTYAATGAKFKYAFIWVLILLVPITYFVQEMTMRLGVVSKRGFAEAVFDGFGAGWGWFTLTAMMLSCWLTLVTEFIGIASALKIFGVPAWVSVAIVCMVMFAMVASGSYWTWEKIALLFCIVNFIYVPAAIMARPSVHEMLSTGLIPNLPGGRLTGGILLFIMANIGTTVCPWMIFFQQSAVVDKGVPERDIKWSRLETFIGAVLTSTVAIFIVVLTGKLLFPHTPVDSADTAARWIMLHNNRTIGVCLAVGLMNAGLLGTICISLASSWSFGEVFGWAHSLNKKVREAPWFYMLYALMLISAGAMVLLSKPGTLILIVLFVQVVATTLMPACMVFLMILLNDKRIAGKWVNRPIDNYVNGVNAVVLIALSTAYNVLVLFPALLPK
ncbi:MAG TPA: divalent metal cation transporter [bacterium]|nr:divalent metal cation transporter [bacterium]